MSGLFAVIVSAVWPPVWGALDSYLMRALGHLRGTVTSNAYRMWALLGCVCAVIDFATSAWLLGLASAGSGLIGAFLWWRDRRRRKRAPRAYGAKSAALLAALVAKARAAAKPRTVLRPVPGGAR
jgi:hypothetical protein